MSGFLCEEYQENYLLEKEIPAGVAGREKYFGDTRCSNVLF
jgi:hypothetical protein